MVTSPIYLPDDQSIDQSNTSSFNQPINQSIYSLTPTLASSPFDASLIDWSNWKNIWTYLEYYQSETYEQSINQSIHPAFSSYGPPPSESSQSLATINASFNHLFNLIGSVCCWFIALIHLQQPHPFAQESITTSTDDAFNFNQYMLWSGQTSCSASDSTFKYFFHSITDRFTTPVPASSNQLINPTSEYLNMFITSLWTRFIVNQSPNQSIHQSHLFSLSIMFACITLIVSIALWSFISINPTTNQDDAVSGDCSAQRSPILVRAITCKSKSNVKQLLYQPLFDMQ